MQSVTLNGTGHRARPGWDPKIMPGMQARTLLSHEFKQPLHQAAAWSPQSCDLGHTEVQNQPPEAGTEFLRVASNKMTFSSSRCLWRDKYYSFLFLRLYGGANYQT